MRAQHASACRRSEWPGGARATVAVDAKDRRNLARGDARHLFHLIRVHAHQPRHARLLPVGAHVVHGVTLLDGTLVPVGAQHSHEPDGQE